MSDKPVSRNANIVVQQLEDEVLIYDLNVDNAFCLNRTTALVFQYADGTNTAGEISDLMSTSLKTLVSEDIVHLALSELDKHGLLENYLRGKNHFSGLSRREVIRKVGLASMVALPLVTSIVAPGVTAAASCIAFAAPCAGGGCCPGSLCTVINICTCNCSSPGDCLVQTSCPSTLNCNGAGVCAP